MRYIWKREWQYREREQGKVLFAAVLPFLTTICVFLFPRAAEELSRDLFSLPAEVCGLLGLRKELPPQPLFFYLQWLYMPFSLFVMGRACHDLSDSILGEEESGRIFFLLNRHCSRYEFVLGKLSYYGCEMAGKLFFYLLPVSLIVLPGSGRAGGGMFACIVRMWACAVLTGAFWMLATFLYVALVPRKQCRVNVWGWMGVLLLAGNLWRLRDLLVLLLHRQNRRYASFYRLTGWLKSLRRLSPLSLINPFAEVSAVSLLLQAGTCLALCAGLFTLGMLLFRLRNITLE